jgi:proline iminopeptidase
LFLPEGALLDGVGRLRHLPAVIVHGRYDVVCPIASADALAQAWPEARYVIVPDAGHLNSEPGIARALLAAVEEFKRL